MNYEVLVHHGIKGQKWGVRRFQNADGSLTAAGQKRYASAYTVTTNKGATASILKKKSRIDGDLDYDIVAEGKKIGYLFLEDHGDELYINWISIKSSARGKGYAQSVMDYVIQEAEQQGKKSITLEVPGSSSDARHIYEKKGFKEEGSIGTEDDVWEGLTKMRREV